MSRSESVRVSLRPATQQDSLRLWEWRNEPATREASFNTAVIPLEDHERWFASKLQGSDTKIFVVAGSDGQDIGYVRFDIGEQHAEISVSVDSDQRGKGYGAAAIRRGCEQILASMPLQRVVALVKGDNPASLAAFQRVGFVSTGLKQIAGSETYELVYEGVGEPGTGLAVDEFLKKF